jgi:hypothetical protein
VSAEPTTLSHDLAAGLLVGDEALRDLQDARPAGRRDRFLVLKQIYDLHRGPLHEVGEKVRWQHHPALAALKSRMEAEWIQELDRSPAPDTRSGEPAEQLRELAARDRAPAIYQWLADEADWESALRFLALEGGPDDLFDDLVATCQVGLPLGPAKMELAGNYWDEMGNGEFSEVHNVLYRRFIEAVELPRIPPDEQPTEALERSALLGLLAVNRFLQPEMVGALGLIELEAGPHCRYVDQGLDRLGASDQARAFYQMHAVVDPLHGAGWVDNAVAPLVEQLPDWAPRILRGARWKSAVNAAFFGWAERTLTRIAA